MSRKAVRHLIDEERIMAGRTSELRVVADDVGDARVLALEGELDATTYIATRDTVVKAVLDEPRVVVIDVSELTIREDPAWAVFVSVRWQTAEWPDVPMGLVSRHQQDRNAMYRNGIGRYLAVCDTVQSAIAELTSDGLRRYRRRVRELIAPQPNSIRRCRELTAEWLTQWSRTEFIHVASLVAAELVEAALTAADAEFALRLETDGSTVSVAVQHVGNVNHVQRVSADDKVSGLDLVAANTRAWGTYTTAAGTTIWAVIGPENRF